MHGVRRLSTFDGNGERKVHVMPGSAKDGKKKRLVVLFDVPMMLVQREYRREQQLAAGTTGSATTANKRFHNLCTGAA